PNQTTRVKTICLVHARETASSADRLPWLPGNNPGGRAARATNLSRCAPPFHVQESHVECLRVEKKWAAHREPMRWFQSLWGEEVDAEGALIVDCRLSIVDWGEGSVMRQIKRAGYESP